MPRLMFLQLILFALQLPTIIGVVNEMYIQATSPTPSNIHCTDENSCPTFSEIIRRASRRGEMFKQIFSSDQNVMFLSGEHVINVSNQWLYIASVERLTLQGVGNTTITCVNELFFWFSDVRDLLIKYLRFTNCKAFAQFLTDIVRENFNYTFVFLTSSKVELNTIEIVSKNATGIVLLDGDSVKVVNSKYSTGGIGIYVRQNSLHIVGSLFRGSSLKVYNSYEDSVIITRSVFEETRSWPVISCFYSKLVQLENIKLISNSAPFLMFISECTVSLEGQGLLYNNSGAVTLSTKGMLRIINGAIVNFVDNIIQSAFGLPGAPLCVIGGKLLFDSSKVTFLNNSGEDCGGILAHGSNIEHNNAIINFTANSGADGGAIAMYKESRLLFFNRNEIIFFRNKASKQGGGLFVDDDGYLNNFHRNFSHSFIGPLANVNTMLLFINNTAKFSGNQIHGGWIDWWITTSKFSYNNNSRNIYHFEPNGPLDISSSPTRVCLCTHSVANCSVTEYQEIIFPGQTINLEVVAVGQRYGTTISFITASTAEAGEVASNPEVIPEAEYFQNIQRTCTPVHYTIKSARKEEKLHLRPFQSNKLTIETKLL